MTEPGLWPRDSGLARDPGLTQRLRRCPCRRTLSAEELHAGLLLAAAVLVILPLLPDRPLALLAGLNLRTLWVLALLVMAIKSLGHVALRLLGPARGLTLGGTVQLELDGGNGNIRHAADSAGRRGRARAPQAGPASPALSHSVGPGRQAQRFPAISG